MKVLRINHIRWSLDDENLARILKEITPGDRGRRGYFTGVCNGKTVFIKTFVEKGFWGLARNFFAPRGRKEYRMGMYLLANGIDSPKPLGYGIARRNSYVVQEWIRGSSFHEQMKLGVTRANLLESLADLLKSLKANHIRHNDLHLDNVLSVDNSLYLIDLHGMQVKESFAVEDEVSNLSHALAMIHKTMDEKENNDFFLRYDSGSASFLRGLTEEAIGRMVQHWVLSKQRRAFSNTSKTVWHGENLCVVGKEDHFQGDFVETVKTDKKVKIERYGDHIRKIYRHGRRLKKAWKAHVVLTYMDLPIIPETYCLRKPAFLSSGYVCMEDLGPRGEELDRHIDRVYDAMTVKERRTFAENLGRFLNSVLSAGIIHRDLKACNIFVLKDGAFRFLDIEDIVFQETDDGSLERALVQLNTTIPARISGKDRIRFFLSLAAELKVDKKQVFRNVVRESSERDIVYEGVTGLKRESW